MNQPCEKTEVISIIRDDLKEVKGDVKSILAFKNKALGLIVGVNVIIASVFNIIIFIFKK